ncbi:nitrate- and nitrite sensing domain-containing protein [Streptosporangium sp. NBC_01639]|uniref:sensor histidine kinase n=1 Tax=Streptosporangium sp. NBC_01639 TaxID=2975948 RepID=UPI003863824E|nr:nitrate- and nitrite sensing domain-containing protein [Streptosporangium sp. NBC_01639]
MRLRNARLRTKVTALLVSLTALWAFTAWVTVREGLNMLGVATLNSGVSDPSVELVSQLQAERRLTLIALGDPATDSQRRGPLNAQRERTDSVGARLRELVGGSSVRLMASEALDQRLGEVFQQLDGLSSVRKSIDLGRLDRLRAAATFTQIIDSVYSVYDSLATLDDDAIAKDTRTFIQLSRAREMFAQEDALVAGALTEGRLTGAERVLFTQIVGTQRFLTAQAVAELPPSDRAAYQRLASSEAFVRVRSMEDWMLQGPQAELAGSVDIRRWSAVSQPALSQLNEVVLAGGAGVVERATPVATGVIVRLVLAGGLGLFAVIASIVLSITTARALIQQLDKLRVAAWELANERLPSVVERIGHGQEVDLAAEAPPLQFGDDQIGHVGQAFNAVQKTAIKVAAEQAQLRRDIADILRNLARRTQSLVHRQLSVLDVMERRENDPQDLRDLFRLDHLATRMRRYAENLLVLSGAAPGRAWRDSVPMIDVVRGSLAEIEDYTRVDVLPLGDAALDGRAVSDVIHLVAELVENAASFSPPYTTVQVSGSVVAHGYALEIEDRGLGMSPEDITRANERIANPPELKLSGNARLGLYVVSRLAERHEVRVTFKISPYGGTTVVVLIPQDLITEQAGPETALSVPQARTAGADALPTGHRRGAGPLEITGGGASARTLAGDPDGEPFDRPFDRADTSVRDDLHGTPPQTRTPARSPAPRDGAARPVADRSASAEVSGALAAPSPTLMPPPDTSHTPGGLPRRVPQTHLAAPLQDDEPAAPAPADDDERSPEAIRAAMASFQSGTRRGRSEAAHLLERDGDPAIDGEPRM